MERRPNAFAAQQTVNPYRAAAARTPTEHTNHVGPNDGVAEAFATLNETQRGLMLKDFPGADKKRLVCAASFTSGELAVAANTTAAPVFRGARICPMDTVDQRNEVFLPLCISADPMYMAHMPDFDSWAISRFWYPEQIGSLYQLGRSTRRVSILTIVRAHLGFIQGVLSDLYSGAAGGAGTSINVLAALVTSLGNFVNGHVIDFDYAKLPDINAFAQLLEKRDNSVDDARKYLDAIDKMSPIDYYYTLFKLSQDRPALVSRSLVPSLSEFICGSLLLEFVPVPDRVDISLSALRMSLERALREIPHVSFSGITDRDELIKQVHCRLGEPLQRQLRYSQFVLMMTNAIRGAQPAQIRALDSTVVCAARASPINGIPAIMMAMCPQLVDQADHLNETVAELLLAAMRREDAKSASILPCEAILRRAATTNIDALVQNSIGAANRVVEAQAKAAAQTGYPQYCDAMYAFMKHIGNHDRRDNLVNVVVSLTRRSDVRELNEFLRAAGDTNLCIPARNIRKWINHASAGMSNRVELLQALGFSMGAWNSTPNAPCGRRRHQDMYSLLYSHASTVSPLSSAAAAAAMPTIEFCDVHKCLANRLTHEQRLAAHLRTISCLATCCVCFEDTECGLIKHDDGAKPHKTDDYRICNKCVGEIMRTSGKCPICRAAMKK